MALLILLSTITSYTALGQPKVSYVATATPVPYKACKIARESLAKQHIVAFCEKMK